MKRGFSIASGDSEISAILQQQNAEFRVVEIGSLMKHGPTSPRCGPIADRRLNDGRAESRKGCLDLGKVAKLGGNVERFDIRKDQGRLIETTGRHAHQSAATLVGQVHLTLGNVQRATSVPNGKGEASNSFLRELPPVAGRKHAKRFAGRVPVES